MKKVTRSIEVVQYEARLYSTKEGDLYDVQFEDAESRSEAEIKRFAKNFARGPADVVVDVTPKHASTHKYSVPLDVFLSVASIDD